MSTATLTQVIHDNKQPNETMSQAVLRMQKDGETLTEAIDRVRDATPTVPEAPYDVTVTSITGTGANINWEAPNNGGSLITAYKVSVTAGGSDITGSPFIVESYEQEKEVTGLTATTEYKTSVIAVNSIGESVASAEVTFNTVTTSTTTGGVTGTPDKSAGVGAGVTLEPIANFRTKQSLQEYAEGLGVKLSTNKTIAAMYDDLVSEIDDEL
jgi:hypothetical protein